MAARYLHLPNRSRRSFVVTAGAALAAIRPAGAQTPLAKIHLAAASDDETIPYVYAQEHGLFRQAGLDVQAEKVTSGAAAVAGVIGGSFDIGKSSLIALFAAHLRGLPVTFIAPGGEWNTDSPVIAIVVRNDSPIKTGADLNGKTLTVSSINDLYAVAAKTWAASHGGDPAAIKLIEIPMSAAMPALDVGRVDAATLTEPFISAARDSGKMRVLCYSPDAIGPHFTMSTWFSTTDYVNKNRPALDRFLRIMKDTAAYANAHHAETLETAAAWVGVEPKVLASATRVTVGVTLDPRRVQQLIDASARANAIPRAFDAQEIISPAALK